MSRNTDRIRQALEAKGWILEDCDYIPRTGPYADGQYAGGWSVEVSHGTERRMLTGKRAGDILAQIDQLPAS